MEQKRSKLTKAQARDQCDQHEFNYPLHSCEPIWKDGHLDKYLIQLHETSKEKESFIKKRNKKMKHTPKEFKKKD